MAASLNRATLIGNLGADPEIRRTQDGRPVANLRIATSESWRDKNTGERKENVEWHRIVCFSEGLCKVIEQYLGKGDTVLIEGQIKTRKWTDKDDIERYSTEIVMQGYDAKLLMLRTKGGDNDGKEYRGDDDRDERRDDRGGGERRSERGREGAAPRGQRRDDDRISTGRQSTSQSQRGRGRDDMNDDIPF